MRFTSEDLMKAMGLSVGDRVKVKFNIYSPYYQDTANCICEIIKDIQGHIMIRNENHQTMFIHNLVDMDYEILPRPKRVGDLICNETDCNQYPLRIIDCMDSAGDMMRDKTLYEILNYQNEVYPGQEIYDLLKARLDKVVE